MRTAALCLIPMLAVGPASAQRGPTTEKVKETLRGVYAAFLEGLVARDTAALSKLLTKDYRFTLHSDSVVIMNRAERLRSIAMDTDSVPNLSLERCEFDLYGAAAAGTCWIRERNVTQNRWVGIVSTVTMVRGVDRRWRLAAVHASRVRPRTPGRLAPPKG